MSDQSGDPRSVQVKVTLKTADERQGNRQLFVVEGLQLLRGGAESGHGDRSFQERLC